MTYARHCSVATFTWMSNFGKYAYSQSCQELDKMIDTTLVFMLNMTLQPGGN